jgi:uncharacterized membrane protein
MNYLECATAVRQSFSHQLEEWMRTDAPVDLYIATYSDPKAGQEDWGAIKQLARDGVIKVDGLVLVRRDLDGMTYVRDHVHDIGRSATIGVGGIIGRIFPPAHLASAADGAGLGAGTRVLADNTHKRAIKEEVDDALPRGSSGIVALVEERWVGVVEKALAKADNLIKHEIDNASANRVKTDTSTSNRRRPTSWLRPRSGQR